MKTPTTLIYFLLFFFLASCATPPQTDPKTPRRSSTKKTSSRTGKKTYLKKPPKPLDLKKISQRLGMDMKATKTGFYQKAFNDCELPREHRLSKGCSTQYLTSIQFRMRCRDSEGTVENVTRLELEPLTAKNIRWDLDTFGGATSTNSRGYGKILARSPYSLKRKQFRLTHNGQIMGVTAAEVRQFVLPKYWCQ